jgi:glyoxylase-like metal-dependent hydrolase (beta-lactamase superfamily II)
MSRTTSAPISRDLTLEALQEAVRWPNAEPRTVLALTGRLLARRRDADGYAYFRERATEQPDQPLFLALEGLFEARMAGRAGPLRRRAALSAAIAKLDRAVSGGPGLANYFRGVVLAELPGVLGKAEAAAADLEWVLAKRERFPLGLRRGVYRALAKAYTTLGREKAAAEALARSGYPSLDSDLPQFVVDYWLTAADGFHFVPPRLVELAPGVHVAQGYDFADFAFVTTDDGIVAIDAASTESHAWAALTALRRISTQPIRQVVLTHAHWDHIGGLNALREAGAQVIAQASFADELEVVNATGVPFRYFFGGEGGRRSDVGPDRLVREPETLTLGGVEFGLYPVRGGETADALLVHLPASGVVFTGDVIMPYLGAPFLPEGSAEGLFEMMRLVQRLGPRLLIHGHAPLTENFTVDTFPGLAAALRDLHDQVLQGIQEAKTVVEILHENRLPNALRSHPGAVLPFLVLRDHFIQRVYHQRTGYWKPDGEGLEPFAPEDWAAAVDLLGGGKEQAFVRAASGLLGRSDYALALEISRLGLRRYPASRQLADLRRQALDRLRELHQQLDPFKFIIYSEWAAAELQPVD